MLRLLLPDQKKEVRREYRMRFAVLALFGLSFVLIAWGVSLSPTYVLLQSEEKVLQEELRVATDTSLHEERTALKEELNQLGKQLKLVDVPTFHISQIIQAVTNAQSRAVGLSSISFDSVRQPDGSLIGTVILSGVANTRNSLLSFAEALRQRTDVFTSVDLPFTNLVKDVEVPFTMTITLVPVAPSK